MVALSDLNDDCLTAVLAYLTFAQLFACISSLHLKNKAFCRCALAALKRSYAPFSLEPKFDSQAKQWCMWLADANGIHLQQLNVPQKFAKSALAGSVEKAEIPMYCSYACGDLGIWLNLTKALPSVKALSVRVLQNPSCAISNISSAFDHVTLKLGALFPKLRSFAVVGLAILLDVDTNAMIEIVRQMPGVVSLKIPSYMLKAFLTRLPAKANELSELILYRNHNGLDTIPCADVFAAVAEARLAELTHLKYTCRRDYYGVPFVDVQYSNSHDCVQTFAALQNLPKLQKLTLDIDFGPLNGNSVSLPRQIDRADLVCLSELNVTLRFSILESLQGMWTDSLFRQFINLRKVHIFTRDAHASLVNLLGSALNHTSITLHEFTVQPIEGSNYSVQRCLPPLLPNTVHDFRQLEMINVTGSEVDLRGLVSEERAINSHGGYPSIVELINLLKGCRSLKYAKMRASVDSPEALKALLPKNCEIVGVVERPCAIAKKACLVLHPDKYWRPVEILISVDKDAVSPTNETAKFALRLIVAQ